MQRMHYFIIVLLALGFVNSSYALPGPLFSVTAKGNQLSIKPIANHYYPSMGIKVTSSHTVTGCTAHANGFCLFAASNTMPKLLSLAGPDGTLSGVICMNGPAQYSCQKFSVNRSFSCKGLDNACRVFVSSSASNGNLGGIAGANNTCQIRADSAVLGGSWRAWLSTSTVNARDNIQYDDNTSYVLAATGAVIAPPGVLVADNGATPLSNDINLDENGMAPASFFVWTGTLTDGTKFIGAHPNCSNWTSPSGAIGGQYGRNDESDNQWTINAAEFGCNTTNLHLYCFEIPS
jgi:Protein of unknown function (DUF1554)